MEHHPGQDGRGPALGGRGEVSGDDGLAIVGVGLQGGGGGDNRDCPTIWQPFSNPPALSIWQPLSPLMLLKLNAPKKT